MSAVTCVLGYILVGIVVSFMILVFDVVGHWLGKNDGNHDMDFLVTNIVLWPLHGFIIARETWRMYREKKP
jgi:hypothetical protein